MRVIQSCNDCRKKRVWESQPFIGTRPAGNVLLSSAILYTGSLPSKALRLFQVLKCATISRSDFFRHQSDFMWPAINSIRKNINRHYLAGLGMRKSHWWLQVIDVQIVQGTVPSMVATLVELTCNEVTDFKLVQVCKHFLDYYR